jgi:hypothetical protein
VDSTCRSRLQEYQPKRSSGCAGGAIAGRRSHRCADACGKFACMETAGRIAALPAGLINGDDFH